MRTLRKFVRRRRNKNLSFFLLFCLFFFSSCSLSVKQEILRHSDAVDLLAKHCQEMIGPPRLERISKHVWLAIGYDLANSILIHTEAGNVIVDPGFSPQKAEVIKKAFLSLALAGPTKAIIYTHTHIDHTGGASVWQEDGTQIWATANFRDHFFKQYGLFLPAETMRARRQFAYHVSDAQLPCAGIGPRIEFNTSLENGTILPTHSFISSHALQLGNLTLELQEAPGETHDHLFIWIPEDKTLIGGDNFYWAFPNLYSLRGTSPRLIDEWIRSIDAMRAKEPEHLVLNHTKPIHGKGNISKALTDYRDAMQWLRDEVIRRANRGEDLETMIENIKLPPHLTSLPYLKELYGQVDWSIKAIYVNYLGWFDGQADQLYPLPSREIAEKEVKLLGGPDKVWEWAEEAWQKKDFKWAIHWLNKLKKSGAITRAQQKLWQEKLAFSYENLAGQISNPNGRGYLLETAHELREGILSADRPKVNQRLIEQIPLELIFQHLPTRLDPAQAMDVHESVQFVFPDEDKRFIVTVRKGVTEIARGTPLPGTPPPVAVVQMNSFTYRHLAFKLLNPLSAYLNGQIKVAGSWTKFLKFMNYFQR